MKEYQLYPDEYTGEVVTVVIELSYDKRHNPHLQAYDLDGMPYGTLSVILDDKSVWKNGFYADTNNNPNIHNWLKENGIAHPTGLWQFSGRCSYPEMTLTDDFVEENDVC